MKFLELLGIIISGVKAVEAAMPEAGKGPEKLQAVKLVLAEATDNLDAMWPALSALVALLVSIYNARGIFRKG